MHFHAPAKLAAFTFTRLANRSPQLLKPDFVFSHINLKVKAR